MKETKKPIFKLVANFRPHGHAYFVDARNRYYVADNSGNLPTDTDDGPLELDFKRPIRAHTVSVPLKGGISTVTSGKEAAWLQDTLSFEVVIGERDE
jgi:hypothetical protein